MSKQYNASSIEVIEGLEAVRKRPGMYIGDTDFRGYHHLFVEIIDNSIDEFLAGFATEIKVVLQKDNSISIYDNGRGIPVDIHPKTKKPAVETILTVLHAGGKFGGENSGYRISGGLHGVGSSVVNALSKFMNVTIYKEGYSYSIKFENGGKLKQKLTKGQKTTKQGTIIHFKPEESFFSIDQFSSKFILDKVQQLAFLNSNLKIEFEDQQNDLFYSFNYKHGLEDYINHEIEQNHPKAKSLSPIFSTELTSKNASINLSLKYIDSSQENIKSFVNNIPTIEGGSHEKAFKSALVKAINDYAVSYNLIEKGIALEYNDLKEGLVAIISIYLVEKYLQFEGQTKSKLSSKYAQTFAEKVIYSSLIEKFSLNQDSIKKIIEQAYLARKAREAARKARELTKELSKNSNKSFAGKLVPAQGKDPKNNELFLVEGDSAGGSAKLARNRKFQAILPLKGKIVNTEKTKISQLVSNEEILSIINSIGGGFGSNFDLKKINYGKIIIMTDADTDGAHIQTLMLTFFYRYMKKMIENGNVYIALPPLYKVIKKSKSKEVIYLWDDKSLKKLKANNSNLEIQRYKGLGEMNYSQLWETTMDPKTRKLIQVNIDDVIQTNKIIETLMGQDASLRKEWINNNIDFNEIDDFEI